MRSLCMLAMILLLAGKVGLAEEASAKLGEVALTVEDEAGEPVASAAISLLKWTGVWEETGIDAESDPHGHATLGGAPIDENLAVRVASDDHAVTMFSVVFSKPETRKLTLKVAPAVEPVIRLRDPDGNPIAGVEVHRLEFVDGNKNSVFATQKTADALHWSLLPSDQQGLLRLPPMPRDCRVTLSMVHPDWKSVSAKNLRVRDGEIESLTMTPGVRVRIELVPINGAPERLDGLKAEVKFMAHRSGSKEPVSIIHPYNVVENGIDLTAYPIEYQSLSVQLDDYFVTPDIMNAPDTPIDLIDLSGKSSAFIQLNVRPKVKAKGKVVDQDGEPMSGVWLYAAIDASSDLWPPLERSDDTNEDALAKLRHDWGSGGNTETGEDGTYEIMVAEGRAYVEAIHAGRFAKPHILEFDVARENATVPTLQLLPVPTLRGTVKDERGEPIEGMMVRMRSRGFGDADPVDATDADGKFVLKLRRIPYLKSGMGLVDSVFVVAVDPNSDRAGITEVDVADGEATQKVEVTLSQRSPAWVLDPLGISETPDSLREVFADLQQQYPEGLPGKMAPDLSEGTWLNTDARSLADYRGKYVLLDFWFIGCGPCYRDMPSIKMAHELFSDQEFAVVSVHRNGEAPESVREFAGSNDMNYAIVVDDEDGTITEQYRALGVRGYPSYLLIGPDGKIVHNDNVSLPPSLRQFKLEKIYAALRE